MSVQTVPREVEAGGARLAASVHTFLALLARDLRVLRREGGMFFVRVVMQPLLFVFVFSYVLPEDRGGEPVRHHGARRPPSPRSWCRA